MKLIVKTLLVVAFPMFFSCGTTEGFTTKIHLTNDSDIALMNKPISIARSEIDLNNETNLFPMLLDEKGDAISAQFNDSDDDYRWDELFFVIDLASREEKNISVKWVAGLPDFPKRTSVRFGKRPSASKPVRPEIQETLAANELPKSLGYQQYQTDGPSWENDMVGFRHYLDGRNAKDLFGKKVTEMSPENVGINAEGAVEDNYHSMEGWGRDVLAVGNSVGIGGYGLAVGDALMRLGVTVDDSVNNIAKTTFKIQAEGPVNSVLSYEYNDWKPQNRSYDVREHTSIWPGMYGYKNTVSVSGLMGNEDLVVGLVNINTDKALVELLNHERYVIVYTHDKQTYDKKWWLGMALILPKERYLGYTDAPKTGDLSNTFLARLRIDEKEPISYYAIAGWEVSDAGFANEDYFVNYLKQLVDQLSATVNIEIRN